MVVEINAENLSSIRLSDKEPKAILVENENWRPTDETKESLANNI